jgi:hypothetical protein
MVTLTVSTYIVIATDSLGCQASEIVTLTPTFSTWTLLDHNYCIGGDATLSR